MCRHVTIDATQCRYCVYHEILMPPTAYVVDEFVPRLALLMLEAILMMNQS